MINNRFPYHFGWIPDYPDFRDFTEEHERIRPLLRKIQLRKTVLPEKADLREYCSPVEDQRDIGACTAHAVAGVVEYFENKSFGKYIDASRLFLYKTTRNLLHMDGDTGAFIRTALGALVLFGMPPEEYWPYNTADFDEEPNAFCYAFGQNYKCISYFRHDPPNITKKALLTSVKKFLTSGIPSIFGFTVYQSISLADTDGCIPVPNKNEKLLGGHAVAAVGYDDNKEILSSNGKVSKGALLIRNSWGNGWGEQGYGWLPYDYILLGLAQDWWSVLKQDWVDTGLFVMQE